MKLPEDCRLTYIVTEEAWYHAVSKSDHPEVSILAESIHGGVAWEFAVEEWWISGQPALRLQMFDDSWEAFDQIPEFFDELRIRQPSTLQELREALDIIGARDATERKKPR